MMVRRLVGLATFAATLVLSCGVAWAGNEYEAPFGSTFGGEQDSQQVFKFGSITVECELAVFGGSLSGRATSIEEQIKSYSVCEMDPGHLATTASVTSCGYKFLEPLGSGPVYEALVSLVNYHGTCELSFKSSACTVTLSAQAERKWIELENINSGSMRVWFKIAKASYKHTGTCSGIGTGLDGSYEGVEDIEGVVVV